MVQSVRPFLMFQGGKAEEAMGLYVSLIPNTKITEIAHFGPDGPGAEGTVRRSLLNIAGQEVMCFDSPVKHAFDFTASFSFFIECSSMKNENEAVKSNARLAGLSKHITSWPAMFRSDAAPCLRRPVQAEVRDLRDLQCSG